MNYRTVIEKKQETISEISRGMKELLALKERYIKEKSSGRIIFPFDKFNVKVPAMAVVTLIDSGKKFPNAITTIEELDAAIEICRDALCVLRSEIDELEAEKKSTAKKATLIVEGTKIYVQGEPTKRDLLANVTFLREKAKRELKETLNSDEVVSAMRALEELNKIFEKYNIPSASDDIALDISFIERCIKHELNGITEIVERHIIPSFDFTEVVLTSLEMSAKKLDEEILEVDTKIATYKPSILARLFKKKRQQEEDEYKNRLYSRRQNLSDKLAKIIEAISRTHVLEKTFVRPFMDQHVGREIDAQIRYITPEARMKITECNRCAKLIEKGNITPYHQEMSLHRVIPTEIITYLEDNNLTLTIRDFVHTVQAMKDLDPGTIKEVERLFCDYTYRDEQPGVVIIRK